MNSFIFMKEYAPSVKYRKIKKGNQDKTLIAILIILLIIAAIIYGERK